MTPVGGWTQSSHPRGSGCSGVLTSKSCHMQPGTFPLSPSLAQLFRGIPTPDLSGQGWDWKCRRHTFHFSGRALACLGSQEPGRNPRLAPQLRISASPIALLETGIPQVHVGRVTGVCKRVCECVCIHAGVCMLECVCVCVCRTPDSLPREVPLGTCKTVSRLASQKAWQAQVTASQGEPGARNPRHKLRPREGLALAQISKRPARKTRGWGRGEGRVSGQRSPVH